MHIPVESIPSDNTVEPWDLAHLEDVTRIAVGADGTKFKSG